MIGTTAAYAAAMTPTLAGSKPISLINSYSTKHPEQGPCRNTAMTAASAAAATKCWIAGLPARSCRLRVAAGPVHGMSGVEVLLQPRSDKGAGTMQQ